MYKYNSYKNYSIKNIYIKKILLYVLSLILSLTHCMNSCRVASIKQLVIVTPNFIF